MKVFRSKQNPLILPDIVKPSREDFEVHYVMNCGVTEFEGDVLLLLRVAETPINRNPKIVMAPYFNEASGKVEVKTFNADDETSKDGINFVVEETPAMYPANKYEEFGIEDPRITKIGDTYYINYSCCASVGVTTCLATTKDFKKFERKGVIFTPERKIFSVKPSCLCRI